jgi:hypothetical protein
MPSRRCTRRTFPQVRPIFPPPRALPVKPSAKPTLVRTQHLPPSKTQGQAWFHVILPVGWGNGVRHRCSGLACCSGSESCQVKVAGPGRNEDRARRKPG